MTTPTTVLPALTPAADEAWRVLFDLADTDPEGWVLIGGQMVYLLAIEAGVDPFRVTNDMDVVMDVRARQGATAWLSQWLVARGFRLEAITSDGVGHRFIRPADPGPGVVTIDVLAPDGIGPRTDT